MSMTSDLADQTVALAADLDQLYSDLVSAGQYGLANQVVQAENQLKQAATSLYSIDADAQINAVQGAAATLTSLTTKLSASAAAIAADQSRVATISGIASSIVTLASDLSGGNAGAAVGAADQVISFLGKL